MSIFNTILEKLGLRKDKPAPTAAAPGAKPASAAPAGVAAKPVRDDYRPATTAPMQAAPKAISEVDVVKKLEQLGSGSGLDWKVSIVDLLKLLGIDSSQGARKELAVELGCPADLMNDSAKMNTWLHKTVLKKIAENGGNIPQSLLN
ncbi:MAG: DUF3597 domain-containing protein [Anaerolineales bacterium]|nr:DUF3597 domain-containing protein [Anaerolineales bacterium]